MRRVTISERTTEMLHLRKWGFSTFTICRLMVADLKEEAKEERHEHRLRSSSIATRKRDRPPSAEIGWEQKVRTLRPHDDSQPVGVTIWGDDYRFSQLPAPTDESSYAPSEEAESQEELERYLGS